MAYIRKSLAVVIAGMFLYWYLDTPLPPDMREPWKVKGIDAAMRSYGYVSMVLYSLGVVEPYSPTDRALTDVFVMTMTTGRPWVQRNDPALKITDMYTEKNRIHLRMYQPLNSLHVEKRPLLFYIHGGGFTVLSVDSYDALSRKLARKSGIPVVSINYRLSPQSPYPVPLEDCIEVIDYISANAESLRFDRSRFAVGGDSAGGNLAASVSLRLRERIKLQLLIVPFLQFFTFNTTSVVENQQYFSKTSNNIGQLVFVSNYLGSGSEYIGDIITSNHTSMQLKASKYGTYVDQERWMDRRYVNSNLRTKDISQRKDFGRDDIPEEFIEKMTNPYVLPLMADDSLLQGLPRAYVMTAGYDFIRDDGIMYAQRLKHAGNIVHHVNHRTAFHNTHTFVEGPLKLELADEIIHSLISYLQTHV